MEFCPECDNRLILKRKENGDGNRFLVQFLQQTGHQATSITAPALVRWDSHAIDPRFPAGIKGVRQHKLCCLSGCYGKETKATVEGRDRH